MKKYLIVLAAALVALASCNNGVQYTSIAFEDAEITIGAGSVKKLGLVWQPTTVKEEPTCVWASSNDTVVEVDQHGNITALEVGEANITATLGEGENALKAVCHVTVKNPIDIFEWGACGLFDLNEDSIIGGEYQHWDEDDQCYYKTQNFLGKIYAWSSGIVYTRGAGLSGAGFIAIIETPVGVIQEGDWKGYYYMPELLFTDTIAETEEGACAPGSLTDAQEWYTYLMDTTYVGDGSFTGSPLHYVDFDNDEGEDFVGFIKDGWLIGSIGTSTSPAYAYYQTNITWFDYSEPCAYGLLLEQDPETEKWKLKDPAEFAARIDKSYELLPAEDVAANRKIQALKINDKAQIRMLKDLSNKKFRSAK